MQGPESEGRPEGEEKRLLENLFLLQKEREDLLSKISALERQTSQIQQSLLWAARVLGPLVLAVLFLGAVVALYPGRWASIIGYILLYPWPQFNKLIIAPMIATQRTTALETTVLLGITDALVALWFVLNFPLVYRIPKVGVRLERVDRRMQRELKRRPWLKPFNILGVFLWVVVPFPGTGTVTGAILGRFLGLGTWKTYATVVVSAVTSVYAYAVGTDAILAAFERSAAQGWAAVVLLTGALGIAFVVYRSWWKPRRAARRGSSAKEGPP